MVYKTGTYGIQAKERYERRKTEGKCGYKNKNGLGYQGEKEAGKIMPGCKRLGHKEIVDYEWKGKLVEVKTAKITKRGRSKNGRWNFLLYKQKGKCDYFMIICRDENNKTEHMFLIPDKDLFSNNLTFSRLTVSKYAKYSFEGGT